MKYVSTLKNIYDTDADKAGRRAVDLAALSRRRFNVPMGFVVTAEALEEFVNHNRLQQKGQKFLANEDYDSLQQAALAGDIPYKVMEEITEAYETLALGEDAEAHEIVDAKGGEPNVTVIPTPNYVLKNEDYSGLYQNVQGLAGLTQAIKGAWASLFTRESFKYRAEKGIREFYSGIMILKMPESEVSAQAAASPEQDMITVETWFGYPEYGMGIDKDRFGVSKDPLMIKSHEVNQQGEKVSRNEKGELEKFPLEERGGQQKVDDKVVVELARLAKKMMIHFNQGMKALYTLDKKKEIYLLLAERLGVAEERDPEPAAENSLEDEETTEMFDEPAKSPDFDQKPAGLPPDSFEEDIDEVSEEDQDDFMKELEKAQEEVKEPPEFDRTEILSDDEENFEPYEEEVPDEAPGGGDEPERVGEEDVKVDEKENEFEPEDKQSWEDPAEKTTDETEDSDWDKPQFREEESDAELDENTGFEDSDDWQDKEMIADSGESDDWKDKEEDTEEYGERDENEWQSEEKDTVVDEIEEKNLPDEAFNAPRSLSRIKQLVHELDDLIDQAKADEVRKKLEEMDEIVRKIRHHHA